MKYARCGSRSFPKHTPPGRPAGLAAPLPDFGPFSGFTADAVYGLKQGGKPRLWRRNRRSNGRHTHALATRGIAGKYVPIV